MTDMSHSMCVVWNRNLDSIPLSSFPSPSLSSCQSRAKKAFASQLAASLIEAHLWIQTPQPCFSVVYSPLWLISVGFSSNQTPCSCLYRPIVLAP